MTDNTFDYIVVGAGHNGLSAACTLGEAGRSVVVIDPLPFLGGLSASRAWVPEAPNHLLSVGAMDDMLMAQTPLTEELGLRRHGYEPIPLEAPYGWINEEGDTLLLFRDFNRTLDDIRYFSPRDAATYAEIKPTLDLIMDLVERLVVHYPSLTKGDLAKLAVKLIPDKKSRALLQKMVALSVFEMISETFESDAMRGLWAYWTSMLGPADLEGTGVYLMGYHAVHRKRGVLRPRGGMTGLMNAFAGKIASHDGQIRLGAGVQEILVSSGRATGVRLTDGTEILARRGVLASCAPQVTLGKLLPEGVLDRRLTNKVAMIPANGVNVAAFKIDFAVGGRVDYPKAAAKRRDAFDVRRTTLMTGTLEEHYAHLLTTKRGEIAESPPVYMAVLSASDPTIAPAGQDVLYLHSNVPADPVGGWEVNRDLYTQTIIKSAERFLSGLDAEIGRIVHTPKDFEDRFATPKGCYFHVDMTPLRLGTNRPARELGGYSTPVPGLYLAGAGSHPGGTVNGWCGRLAAQTAIRDETGIR
ncbi:NAD(P)/FAD-dependent oxidoreductase [Mycolicibacterium pulveris]|uniref:Pyridine nucleotide-disulfide oxidoreductase domain-containing protein 2 n=1 Tax=Mycolicibacterium pulveris TaxID=36813 RepID=A0A7I7UFG7_MYCPV|nr:NAD(P)/FAD-dependent oxidoreductase [Mycolicibacterium pulveris]MCV6981646.1 NAD(P)/FAD-dependent oxidoreductase [Mycolicibacterium pulveris]BBY80198.1 beta-carotene ketolase [Mycolicibacterium pulveris]